MELPSNSAFYEADWYAAYALLRLGKFAKAAGKRFGKDVKSLFVDCLLHGHFKIGDLENKLNYERAAIALNAATHPSSKGPRPNINGSALPQLDSVDPNASFHAGVYSLLQNNFLALADRSHFRPHAENMMLAEESTKRIPKWSDKIKKKEVAEFQLAIQNTLNSWLQGSPEQKIALKNQTLNASDGTLKRNLNEDSEDSSEDREEAVVPTKKRRLANGVAKINGTLEDSDQQPQSHVPADVAVCVNYRKSAVTARTDKLVQLAKGRMGATTTEVYSSLLMLLERDIYQCSNTKQDIEAEPVDEYEEQPRVSTLDIVASIKDLGGLRKESETQHRKEHRRKGKDRDLRDIEDEVSSSKGDMGNEEGLEDVKSDFEKEPSVGLAYNEDEAEKNDSVHLVRQHLLGLAEHEFIKFLHHHEPTAAKPESWSVPFRTLSDHLRVIELNRHIALKHGRLATRIVSHLQAKGMVEEKRLKEPLGQLQPNIQAVVMSLVSTGMIEVQEVPRDNNRQPNRTIWLYYFDADRCGRKVLEETYQTMSRHLQRIRVEREAVQDVLNKAARTDVVGREEELLGKGDLATLKQLKASEEMLLGKLARLDDTVLVLRDFQGH
ncbi:RNA polymerase III subunit C82 [Thelotrema lepadinum]|nr:RNA polymerase III subunit C82 [Thelotrema lepadinum]